MSAVHVSSRPAAGAILREYFQLTKPTIVMLMLVTGLPAILMAGKGSVDPLTMVVALVGTAMAAGAASALNHYWDRDIDAVMERTSARPIPGGHVSANQALAFGLIMGALSVLLLGLLTTWLAAMLALASILFYVVIYTMWLKRSTPQNIVIGGAAGATAPLIGWAAVTGNVGLPAWLMFLIIFMWTPPHFWALALYRRDDYAKAGVPMMPVVAGEDSTRFQIVVYTVLLLVTTIALYAVKACGLVYLIGATGLGAWFLRDAVRLYRSKSEAHAKKLFFCSIVYLLVLFVVLFIDAVARMALPWLR
ncbi:MAG TPA: heme o synthase [Stenomitos sp.]